MNPTDQDQLRESLAARADAEGILDVAYTTADSPFGPLLLARHASAAWCGSGCRPRTRTSCCEELARRVSPRVLEAPAELDEARRELDSLLRGAAAGTSTCRSTGG